MNRVESITDSHFPTLPFVTYEYDGSRVTLRQFPQNQTCLLRKYDRIRRVTEHCHLQLSTPGTEFAYFEYDYDRVGNREYEKFKHEPGSAPRDEYAYDSAYRVVQADHGVGSPSSRTLSYALDGVGNRTEVTDDGASTKYNFALGQNWLDPMNEYFRVDPDGAAPRSLVHDENGNLTDDGDGKTFFYDSLNRLVRVQQGPNTIASYRYDAYGRRVERTAQGATYRYAYDGSQEVQELRFDGASTSLEAEYTWGTAYVDELLALRRLTAPGSPTYFAHASSIYSVAALTDQNGDVVERYDYETIYGEVVYQDENFTELPGGSDPVIGNAYLFQGRRLDPETGWYHFRARMLDPELGRFVQRDPLGMWADAVNLGNAYAFAGNNPVNLLDPTGKCSDEEASEEMPDEVKEQLPENFEELSEQEQKALVDEIIKGLESIQQGLADALGWTDFRRQLDEYYSKKAGGKQIPWEDKALLIASFVEAAALTALVIGTGYLLARAILTLGWRAGKAAFNSLKNLISRARSAWAARGAKVDPNKLRHVFRSGHNLDDLVRASGNSTESAFKAVQRAANQALKDGLLKPDARGVLPGRGAGTILNVNGVDVQLVGGRVIDGVVRIGTFVGL